MISSVRRELEVTRYCPMHASLSYPSTLELFLWIGQSKCPEIIIKLINNIITKEAWKDFIPHRPQTNTPLKSFLRNAVFMSFRYHTVPVI